MFLVCIRTGAWGFRLAKFAYVRVREKLLKCFESALQTTLITFLNQFFNASSLVWYYKQKSDRRMLGLRMRHMFYCLTQHYKANIFSNIHCALHVVVFMFECPQNGL